MASQLGQSTPEKCLLYPGVPEEFVTSNSWGLFCSVRESICCKILCGLYDQRRPGDSWFWTDWSLHDTPNMVCDFQDDSFGEGSWMRVRLYQDSSYLLPVPLTCGPWGRRLSWSVSFFQRSLFASCGWLLVAEAHYIFPWALNFATCGSHLLLYISKEGLASAVRSIKSFGQKDSDWIPRQVDWLTFFTCSWLWTLYFHA